ncbi:alpha/beta-hydrolase [Calocera viscosa TUFC12733]|uniref:Alpha/beta-hydrolase n=1 Tax=Calocera viscosa (strain TUFC12733) TaxID=1330018 RepID=A0A167JUR6_CALVF|nr:alpha/beta-hydrolase [Calocera viscosa TUFC12733]
MAQLYDEEWVLGPDKIHFYTRKYEPPQGIAEAKVAILFLHGFVEHVARYEHVFPVWAERGIAVLAFDQRGFGRTADGDATHKGTGRTHTTTEDQMDDVDWFLRRLEEWAPDNAKLFLVGHSMGGFNAVNFMCSPQSRAATLPKISGVVALSPLMGLAHPPAKFLRSILSIISLILPSMSVDVAVKPEWLSRDPAVSKSYAEDNLVFKRGTIKCLRTMLDGVDELNSTLYRSYPQAVPLLWVHGTADEVNSYKQSFDLFEKMKVKQKSFTPYEGGFHELLNEPHPMKETLMDEIAKWILERSATGSPEGAKARL